MNPLGWSFLLKKVISFILMPLSIAFILLFIALWFLHKEKIKKAKFYLVVFFIWTMLISSAPVANALLKPLVFQYPQLKKVPSHVEYIVLLGGNRERRTWEAIRLYNQSKSLKIITSGYSLMGTSDAKITAQLLVDSGVNKEQIFMQEKAKDTKEEALAIKKRLSDKEFILVTSAHHMPRAMKLFENEGLKPIAAPTNTNEFYDIGILKGEQLLKTERALHEYIGLLWMYIQG